MYSSVLSSISLFCIVAAALDTNASPKPQQLASATECAAQPVLELCLSSTSAIALSCATTDYSCLCQKYTDVLTCYNNCPDDVRRASTLSSQSAYCSNASMYSSTQTSILPSSSVSSAAATTLTGTSKTGSIIPSATISGSPSMTGTTSSSSGVASSTTSTSESPTSTHESSGNTVKSSMIWLLAASFALLA